jgi:hypothetical protein
VLGPQDCQLHRCIAQTPSTTGQICASIDLQRRLAHRRNQRCLESFADAFRDFPKATKKIMDELDLLLAFYDFPTEHWLHLRTTNPIESTFSTVRLRTRVTRGAGSRKAALAMAYKLLDAAQARWHKHRRPGARATGAGGRHLHRRQTTREEASRDRARSRRHRDRRSLSRKSHPQLLTISRQRLGKAEPTTISTGGCGIQVKVCVLPALTTRLP